MSIAASIRAALLGAAATISSCAGPAPAYVTLRDSLAPLREDFNDLGAYPRVLAILSPT